nr:MAG TPA: hypothetical protein [Caudoviricetes sp.]
MGADPITYALERRPVFVFFVPTNRGNRDRRG